MKASYYIAAICSAAFSLALWLSPLGETVENGTADFFLSETASGIPPKDIVIVAIDESSFANLSRPWPWPRTMHGQLVERLLASGAAAVAFDIVFSEPSTIETDEAFARSLSAAGRRVVLGAEVNIVDDPQFAQQILVTPLTMFTASGAGTGYINLPLEDDGFVRRMATPIPGKETLAYAGVRALREQQGRPIESAQSISQALIHFSGAPRTIRTVSYYQVLENLVRPDFFKNKLVFVGVATSLEVTSQKGVRDHFLTPFSRRNGGYMAGVEIQANIADNILSGTAIHEPPANVIRFAIFVLAFAFTILFFALSPIRGAMFWILVGIGACLIAWQGLVTFQMYVTPWILLLPQTVALLISILVQYARTLQEKNFIRRVFSTYLSPKVVQQLLDQPGYLALGGEQIEGSVLFLDIVGFSLIAEQVSPQELVQIVNRCLGALSAEVFASDGMVDKFIGDSIMAVWGAPFPVSGHAERATRAALRMQERIIALSAAEREISGAPVSVRIGVCSGPMVAGNVGDTSYVNYTVLGSTVNVAARMEGLCKVYGVQTLLAESTVQLLDPSLFVFRELDIVVAKGLGQKTRIFELQGIPGDMSEKRLEVNRLFAEGRVAYFAERFSDAKEFFKQALSIDSSDGPSAVFLLRSETYIEDPPVNWDGVYLAAEK